MNGYGRFYRAASRVPVYGDREEWRRDLVEQFTEGRTRSLKEMTEPEYRRMCEAVESMTMQREELRYQRSVVLRLMQQWGVDTTDWGCVNAFCRDRRIAGKDFGRLWIEDLQALARKLRVMLEKGRTGGKPEVAGRSYVISRRYEL